MRETISIHNNHYQAVELFPVFDQTSAGKNCGSIIISFQSLINDGKL